MPPEFNQTNRGEVELTGQPEDQIAVVRTITYIGPRYWIERTLRSGNMPAIGQVRISSGKVIESTAQQIDATEDHVLRMDDDGSWDLQHPIRERLDGSLFNCDVHKQLRQEYPHVEPGRYNVKRPWDGGKGLMLVGPLDD